MHQPCEFWLPPREAKRLFRPWATLIMTQFSTLWSFIIKHARNGFGCPTVSNHFFVKNKRNGISFSWFSSMMSSTVSFNPFWLAASTSFSAFRLKSSFSIRHMTNFSPGFVQGKYSLPRSRQFYNKRRKSTFSSKIITSNKENSIF